MKFPQFAKRAIKPFFPMLILIGIAGFSFKSRPAHENHFANPSVRVVDSPQPKKNTDTVFMLVGRQSDFVFLLNTLNDPEPTYRNIAAITQWIRSNVRIVPQTPVDSAGKKQTDVGKSKRAN